MNIRNLFFQATKEQRKTDLAVKNLLLKIDKKEAQLESLRHSISHLEKERNSLTGNALTIFSKAVSLGVTIRYRYNTNSAEVDSDPHGRGSDRDYEDGKVETTITSIAVKFRKEEKKLYHPKNFYVEAVLSGKIFHKLVFLHDLTLWQSSRDEDYYFGSMDTNVLLTDPDLQKVLAYLKKRLK